MHGLRWPAGDRDAGHGRAARARPWPARLRAVALGGLLIAGLDTGLDAGPARAASYEVVPIRVELAAGQSATTVVIRNLGDAASSVQVRAFAWTQQGDRDDLTPTDDVALSPPIFTVAPNQAQTVRLLLRSRAAERDRAYRLLFDEVPPPGRPGQIVMAMRLSIPVILDLPTTSPPVLTWQARRGPGGQLSFLVANTGARYARLGDAAVHLPDGRSVALRPAGDNPYVLPGAERSWLPAAGAPQLRAPPGGALRLTVSSQAGPMEQAISLPP